MQHSLTAFERMVYRFAYIPSIRRQLVKIPIVRRIYGGWNRTHPFDVAEEVDTSGYLSVDKLTADEGMRSLIIPYAGSSPSIIRAAIETLPDVREHAFVDLGCGKGRAMLVASEYALGRVIGVELSPMLVATAQQNVRTALARHPERTPMEVVQANALEFELPRGKVVIYMYHAFGRDLMMQLTAQLGAAVKDGRLSQVFVIYVNPVYAAVLDSSPVLTRFYAATLTIAEEEVGYAPDIKDTVVIWQGGDGDPYTAHPGADRRVIMEQADWQAGLS